jgi:15-cis-phytoene synthase
VSAERVKMLAGGATMEANERAMLRALGSRAEGYYASADRLLPLIDADSRAALWVLVTIYHQLLLRISKADSDVFTQRIRVSTPAKMAILAQGAVMALRNRVVP